MFLFELSTDWTVRALERGWAEALKIGQLWGSFSGQKLKGFDALSWMDHLVLNFVWLKTKTGGEDKFSAAQGASLSILSSRSCRRAASVSAAGSLLENEGFVYYSITSLCTERTEKRLNPECS